MTGLIFVMVLTTTSMWVAVDASNLGAPRDRNLGVAGSSPLAWGLACIVMWIVFFPLYLAKRTKIRAAGLEHRHGTMRPLSEPAAAGDKECPRSPRPSRPGPWCAGSAAPNSRPLRHPRPLNLSGASSGDETRVETPVVTPPPVSDPLPITFSLANLQGGTGSASRRDRERCIGSQHVDNKLDTYPGPGHIPLNPASSR